MFKKELILFFFLTLTLFVFGCSQYFGETKASNTAQSIPLERFDLNGNGEIDNEDLLQFNPYFNTRSGGPANEEGNSYTSAYDFNGDGGIDDTDYFLLSDNFGKKYSRRIAKPVSVPVGEYCKEAFVGHNGPVDERVNLVFIGFNYPNTDSFLDKIWEVANPYLSPSFFDYEPLKSNTKKFNLWYVDVAERTSFKPSYLHNPYIGVGAWGEDTRDFSEKFDKLIKECNVSEQSLVAIAIINAEFRDSAEFQKIYYPKSGKHSDFFHEFVHAFLQLTDEYVLTSEGQHKDAALAANCDVASSEIACPKWCKGKPFDIELLKSIECSGLISESCLKVNADGSPCFLIGGGTGVLGEKGACINKVALCTSITDKETCLSTTNNRFYMLPLCGWSLEKHPYYQSQCFPSEDSINIGMRCAKGTGCYNGCYRPGSFRAEKEGVLRNPGMPLGEYNEKLMCNKIKNVTGSVGGKCDELYQLFGG